MGCFSLHRLVGATGPAYSRQPWNEIGQERRERQDTETERKGGGEIRKESSLEGMRTEPLDPCRQFTVRLKGGHTAGT